MSSLCLLSHVVSVHTLTCTAVHIETHTALQHKCMAEGGGEWQRSISICLGCPNTHSQEREHGTIAKGTNSGEKNRAGSLKKLTLVRRKRSCHIYRSFTSSWQMAQAHPRSRTWSNHMYTPAHPLLPHYEDGPAITQQNHNCCYPGSTTVESRNVIIYFHFQYRKLLMMRSWSLSERCSCAVLFLSLAATFFFYTNIQSLKNLFKTFLCIA